MPLRETLTEITDSAVALRSIHRSGLVRVARLDRAARMAADVHKFGNYAGSVHAFARTGVRRDAIVDDHGPLSYKELDRRSNALVRVWQEDGLDHTAVIAAMCRNHRGLVLTMLASEKIGAKLVMMNTGFAGPQLADIADREKVSAIVFDDEFAEPVDALPDSIYRYLGWSDEEASVARPTLAQLIEGQSRDEVPAPPSPGTITLLTSGTTGTPKGASRGSIPTLAAAQILSPVPLRAKESMLTAAPLFHGTGLAMFGLGLALRNTMVMTRKFDPERCLQLAADHGCHSIIVVPTMLHRMVNLEPSARAAHATPSLKIIFSAGASLSPDLCRRTAECFGDVLYNMYGSTEVAVATIATPADLKRSPGTAGRPPVTCRVALFDDDGKRITKRGVVGRIFATNAASFGGYTDGRDKERIEGMVSTGDVGHFDSRGMLFVEGRDDDMIVSGGENVYPIEVENLLADREDIIDVAVVGVDDEEWGRRLRAVIVPSATSRRDAQEIRDHVKANLARTKVPRDVLFIDELPRNATGKLLRNRLTELVVDR